MQNEVTEYWFVVNQGIPFWTKFIKVHVGIQTFMFYNNSSHILNSFSIDFSKSLQSSLYRCE